MKMTREQARQKLQTLYDSYVRNMEKNKKRGRKFADDELNEAYFKKMLNDDKEIDKYIRVNEFNYKIEKQQSDILEKMKNEQGFKDSSHPIGRNMRFFMKVDGSEKSERNNKLIVEMFGGPGCIKIQNRIRQEAIQYDVGSILNKRKDADYRLNKFLEEFLGQYSAFNNPLEFSKAGPSNILPLNAPKTNEEKPKNKKEEMAMTAKQYTKTFWEAYNWDRAIMEEAYCAKALAYAYITGLTFIFDANSPNILETLGNVSNYTIDIKGLDKSASTYQADLDYADAVNIMADYFEYQNNIVQHERACKEYGIEKFKEGSMFLNYKAYDISDPQNPISAKLKDALDNPDKNKYQIVERTEQEKADLLNIYSEEEKKDQEKQLKEFDNEIWKKALTESNTSKKLNDNSMFFSFMQSSEYSDLEKSVKTLLDATKNPKADHDINALVEDVKTKANSYITYKQAKAAKDGDPNLDKDSRGHNRVEWAKELVGLLSMHDKLAKEYDDAIEEMFKPQQERTLERVQIEVKEAASEEIEQSVDIVNSQELAISNDLDELAMQ